MVAKISQASAPALPERIFKFQAKLAREPEPFQQGVSVEGG